MNRTLSIFAIAQVFLATGACSTTPVPADAHINYQGSGAVTGYHANGKVKRKADFIDGQMVAQVSYFASGTRASQEEYVDGRLHTATYYFASGRVKSSIRSTRDE